MQIVTVKRNNELVGVLALEHAWARGIVQGEYLSAQAPDMLVAAVVAKNPEGAFQFETTVGENTVTVDVSVERLPSGQLRVQEGANTSVFADISSAAASIGGIFADRLTTASVSEGPSSASDSSILESVMDEISS